MKVKTDKFLREKTRHFLFFRIQQNNPRKFLERSETAISEQHLNPKMLIVKEAEL